MTEIVHAIEVDEGAKGTKWSTLLARQNRKRVLITFLLGFFSQWVVRLFTNQFYILTIE
jgi:predicted MFS family arabinose efflux permease